MDSVIIGAIITAIAMIIAALLQRQRKTISERPTTTSNGLQIEKQKEKRDDKNFIPTSKFGIYKKVQNFIISKISSKKLNIDFIYVLKSSKTVKIIAITLIMIVLVTIVLFVIIKEPKETYRHTIVTNGDYQKFIENTGIIAPLHFKNNNFNKNDPVINVNWHNAKKYCEWVGGRLLTEKEWRSIVDSNSVNWNLREWTYTDTLDNCAVTCNLSNVGTKIRSLSFEPKSSINDQITFRCLYLTNPQK